MWAAVSTFLASSPLGDPLSETSSPVLNTVAHTITPRDLVGLLLRDPMEGSGHCEGLSGVCTQEAGEVRVGRWADHSHGRTRS